MDVEALLSDRSDDAPSGENLEYDMDFINLELAAAPGEERQAGKEILAAEEPDWGDVRAKALAVMERSHDLRAGVYFAQAALNTDGLIGFAEATAYLRGCLERHWATCYPQLDADDDDDPTMRVNAMKNLAAPQDTLRYLRRTALSESRTFGRVSLRDFMVMSGELPPAEGEKPLDAAAVSAAFQDSDAETLATRQAAAARASDDVKAIDAKFTAEIGSAGPDFSELLKSLRQILRHFAEQGVGGEAAAAEAAVDEAEPGAAPAAGGAVPAAGGVPGTIASQRDVVAALDRILGYYERQEPSSPVPILLSRAKRLVGADFMTIIQDMAPGGIDNVRNVGGIWEE
jgi:type VI secretion system protein ImpA